MSPTLPQPAPLQVQTLEAGKGLARLAQAEQPLDRGSVLSRLGAGLQLRRCGSSLGPFQYRLARTRRQPNSSLPRAGTGHPGLGTKHCLELFAQGLVPLRWGCAREPKRTCQGPKTHPHVSALQQSSGEAQSGRRFLGTNGGSLWRWCCLAQAGALGPCFPPPSASSGRPGNRLGMQPWALSLPDKELCLREALAVCTPPAPEPSAKRPGS